MAQAQDPFEEACERFQGLFPRECFFYKVPFWLQSVRDNTVFPSHELRAGDGCQWMKASRFEEFVEACKGFAESRGPHSTLRVVVMPYMPLRDASLIEKLLIVPPNGNEEAIEAANPVSQEHGMEVDSHDDTDSDEEDDKGGPWTMMSRLARFEDLGVTVEVVIMNYPLLQVKAGMYELMTEPFDGLISSAERIGEAIEPFFKPFSANGALHLSETAYLKAKQNLIFAMVDAGMDPHDNILLLFPQMHDTVYQLDCVHCNPDIDYANELDPPETLERLKAELDDIGFQEHEEGSLPVKYAQIYVMEALGELDRYQSIAAMRVFRNAHRDYLQRARQAIRTLNEILTWPTVQGVHDEELLLEESSQGESSDEVQ